MINFDVRNLVVIKKPCQSMKFIDWHQLHGNFNNIKQYQRSFDDEYVLDTNILSKRHTNGKEGNSKISMKIFVIPPSSF